MAQSCATSNQEDRVTNPRYKGNGEGSNHVETGDGNKRTSWRGRNDGGGHRSNAVRRPTGWGQAEEKSEEEETHLKEKSKTRRGKCST